MFEDLPKDVALYITSIFVKHSGTDDIYNLAMSSELLKSYVIHVMGNKVPEQCAEQHGPMEWALLLRGKILEVVIPSDEEGHDKIYLLIPSCSPKNAQPLFPDFDLRCPRS
ncbi:hypothetical protein FGB62_4g040 [Gracilaria domingensis]|nr:hypothetical protein FGB62_4g040 [Gracilaria domingensis]